MTIMFAQNVDRIVRHNEFVGSTTLFVTSIFPTIQGEGPHAGRPALFIRLAGCNFGDKQAFCQFCDTSFQIDKARQYSVDELCAVVQSFNLPQGHLIVLTGGEPTLQPLLATLISMLIKNDHIVQLETNGTQAYFFNLLNEEYCKDVNVDANLDVVVSPKTSRNTYPPISPKVLSVANCLKFVLSADENSPYHTIPQEYLDPSKRFNFNIYVSPMAVYKRAYDGEVSSIWDDSLIDREATSANYSYAARYVMDNPHLLLSVQTHLFTAIP